MNEICKALGTLLVILNLAWVLRKKPWICGAVGYKTLNEKSH